MDSCRLERFWARGNGGQKVLQEDAFACPKTWSIGVGLAGMLSSDGASSLAMYRASGGEKAGKTISQTA